jgi:hypothetical protein
LSALAEALKENNTLQSLELRFCNFGKLGLEALAEALSVNTSLKQLSFGAGKADSDGFIALTMALRKNQTLEELTLSVETNSVAIIALAEAMKVNQGIKALELFSCPNYPITIGDNEAIALAQNIQENHSLTHLWLDGMELSDTGLLALATLNNTLQYLSLVDCNNLSVLGAQALLTALDKYISFEKIILESTNISMEVNEEIQQKLQSKEIYKEALLKELSESSPLTGAVSKLVCTYIDSRLFFKPKTMLKDVDEPLMLDLVNS